MILEDLSPISERLIRGDDGRSSLVSPRYQLEETICRLCIERQIPYLIDYKNSWSGQFLLKAARDYGIDLKNSWMIGDRDSDIECGKAAGTRTIMILKPQSIGYRGAESLDCRAENLRDAVQILLRDSDING